MGPGDRHSFTIAYAEHTFPEVRRFFPPQRDIILAWSAMFRSGGTFRNYLGYVKTGCMVMNESTVVSGTLPFYICESRACVGPKVFDDPAVQKAKRSVDKCPGFAKREPRWVRRWMVERFLEICCLQQKAFFAGDAIAMGMLFLFSYIFLLRVPSEALPAQAHQGGHSVLSLENGRLILVLQRRRDAHIFRVCSRHVLVLC